MSLNKHVCYVMFVMFVMLCYVMLCYVIYLFIYLFMYLFIYLSIYLFIYEISEWSPAEIIQNLSTEMKNRFCCNFYTINTSIVIFYNSTVGFI